MDKEIKLGVSYKELVELLLPALLLLGNIFSLGISLIAAVVGGSKAFLIMALVLFLNVIVISQAYFKTLKARREEKNGPEGEPGTVQAEEDS